MKRFTLARKFGNNSLIADSRLKPAGKPKVSFPMLYGEPKARVSGYNLRRWLTVALRAAEETRGGEYLSIKVSRIPASVKSPSGFTKTVPFQPHKSQ